VVGSLAARRSRPGAGRRRGHRWLAARRLGGGPDALV